MPPRFEHLWILAAITLVACSSEQSAPPITWHRDVAPLVQERCGGCHVEGGAAPFALQSHAQAFERRAEIREAVSSRRMPPWQPGAGCAEYHDDTSLSEEQISLISRWVDAGAPILPGSSRRPWTSPRARRTSCTAGRRSPPRCWRM